MQEAYAQPGSHWLLSSTAEALMQDAYALAIYGLVDTALSITWESGLPQFVDDIGQPAGSRCQQLLGTKATS